MSQKVKKKEEWPPIDSIVLLHPGTRIDCGDNTLAIIPPGETDIYGVVLGHYMDSDWNHDRIEVLVGDVVHEIMRTPSSMPGMNPYFNIKIIEEEKYGHERKL